MIKITGYNDKGKEINLDDQTVTSATGDVAKLPIDISALIPSNNTPFIVSVTVEGLECSECAGGYGGDPITSPCKTTPAFDNSGSYIGLKSSLPRWYGTATYREYKTKIDIASMSRTANVPNTCWSCIVNP